MVGISLETMGGILVVFMPETLSKNNQETFTDSENARSEDDSQDDAVESVTKGSAMKILLSQVREMIESMCLLWKNTNVVLVLLMFLVATISRQSTGLFLQYTSVKFNWSIAHVSDELPVINHHSRIYI